jgi:hypothetical protein
VAHVFPKWTNKIPFAIALAVPVKATALVVAVWYWFSPQYTDVGYQPEQPIPFSHKLHAGDLGMDCRYCHNTVERAAHAAVPATQTCIGCHEKLILPESIKLAPLRAAYAADQPVPWIKVHMLPDYAYFDHSVHVAAGVGCVSCHGRIDQMKVVAQSKSLSMGWCLDCHRNPTPNLRPVAQVTNMAWTPGPEGYSPAQDPHRTRTPQPPTTCSGCHR